MTEIPSPGGFFGGGCHRPPSLAFYRLVTDLTSRATVERLRRGDRAAFDEVHASFHPRIYSFLVRLSRRRDVAEDLAQETWLKFARSCPGLDPETALGPFLFTIARNAFVSYRRWAMLDLSRLVLLGLEAVRVTTETPETQHENARAIDTLERALAALPVASREVLLLVGVEGMEQEEVARVLGLAYPALRQRLHRARSQLAEAIARLEVDSRAKAPTPGDVR